jgi:hypothetical protein
VTDGNVLSGVVGGAGIGGTTSSTLPVANTLIYSDGTGANVSGYTSGATISVVEGPPVLGDSGRIQTGLFNASAVGINTPGTSVSGPISAISSGGGPGSGSGGQLGGPVCGWAGGVANVGCGGGASAFGPGGAGSTSSSTNGSAPPSYAFGAGGGAPGSAGTGAGANGMPGCILIEYL